MFKKSKIIDQDSILCDFFVKQILEYIMDSATVPRPVTGGDES